MYGACLVAAGSNIDSWLGEPEQSIRLGSLSVRVKATKLDSLPFSSIFVVCFTLLLALCAGPGKELVGFVSK